MNKKITLPAILFFAVSIIGIILLSNDATVKPKEMVVVPQTSQIILFYGDGCPHCVLVENFVAENNIEAKVTFAKKEVYNNKKNADELVAKAEMCGMPTDSIGVPFLWDGAKCLVGDQDIIEFFKLKANIQ